MPHCPSAPVAVPATAQCGPSSQHEHAATKQQGKRGSSQEHRQRAPLPPPHPQLQAWDSEALSESHSRTSHRAAFDPAPELTSCLRAPSSHTIMRILTANDSGATVGSYCPWLGSGVREGRACTATVRALCTVLTQHLAYTTGGRRAPLTTHHIICVPHHPSSSLLFHHARPFRACPGGAGSVLQRAVCLRWSRQHRAPQLRGCAGAHASSLGSAQVAGNSRR